MARSVNEEDFATRRNEIIDAAQQLIYTRGYEQMTIQDVLNQLGISKGAFYHYFGSKQALLEALIDRMRVQAEQILAPLIYDPALPALVKYQSFFDSMAQWKTAKKDLMMALLRVWYHDDNVLVREKARLMAYHHVLPMLTHIICQGVREGVMTTLYPGRISEVVLSIMLGMSDSLVALALAAEDDQPGNLDEARRLTQMYTDAIERVLGITPGTLVMMDESVLKAWFGSE